MRALVLGGGVIGVAAAWYLARDGHEVTLADRQSGPALETSKANGGQISAAHAEPWANPRAPATILKWLGREDAPLLFRLRADARQWAWGLRFLCECLPARNHRNTVACVKLALYSRHCLRELVAAEGIEYDAVARGILEFHLDAAGFDHAGAAAERMSAFGADRVPCVPARCIELEPALAPLADRLVGGIHTPIDESGDAHVFTVALAARAAARGVRFLWNTTIDALDVEGGRVARARARSAGRVRSLEADAYVVALGSYSPLLLEPLRVPCPVYPVKGYSLTLDIGAARGAWTMSLTDPAQKLVFSRLGECLRVAGTAELDGWNTSLNDMRCKALLERTFELFPLAGEWASARYWAGLRPATPSNVPVIGRTRYPNLWLDTGHGTLGWTMACGSGQALAELVAGRTPAVDFRFLGAQP